MNHVATQGTSRGLIGRWNPAVALTLSGPAAAVAACAMALRHELELAFLCLIVAGICDLFDGPVARRLGLDDDAMAFGAQLDSLADMASFGLAPSVLVVAVAPGPWLGPALAVAIVYTTCAAVRLAHFNVHGMAVEAGRSCFVGLPVTYSALILPLVFLAAEALARAVGIASVTSIALDVAALVTGVHFVRRVSVPKPRGVLYVVFPLLALLAAGVLMAMRWG